MASKRFNGSVKSVIELEEGKKGTQARWIGSESWCPVFAWRRHVFCPAIRAESYVAVSHRVLQSRTHGGHVGAREKPARQVSKGATRSSAPESETFFGSRCALAGFFCQSNRVVPWKRCSAYTGRGSVIPAIDPRPSILTIHRPRAHATCSIAPHSSMLRRIYTVHFAWTMRLIRQNSQQSQQWKLSFSRTFN